MRRANPPLTGRIPPFAMGGRRVRPGKERLTRIEWKGKPSTLNLQRPNPQGTPGWPSPRTADKNFFLWDCPTPAPA